jgi:hypothetical protein
LTEKSIPTTFFVQKFIGWKKVFERIVIGEKSFNKRLKCLNYLRLKDCQPLEEGRKCDVFSGNFLFPSLSHPMEKYDGKEDLSREEASV